MEEEFTKGGKPQRREERREKAESRKQGAVSSRAVLFCGAHFFVSR